MKKYQTKAFTDLVASLVFIAIGIWAYVKAGGFNTINGAAVQPSVFPRIMIVGLLFFSAVLLVQSILRLSGARDSVYIPEKGNGLNIVKDKGIQAAVAVIVLCVLYVALLNALGYVIDSFLLCGIIMFMIGKRKWKILIPVSILVPLLMWVIFYKVLTVNVPMGPLSFLKTLVDKI